MATGSTHTATWSLTLRNKIAVNEISRLRAEGLSL
jgi:hypothetical protein